MTNEFLFAGFGGQGILFAGKLLAYKGLTDGKEVSWLPSYGPEMRGGTASCSIILSDTPVGSPIVSNPDILIAMNLPSLDKYEKTVKKGGMIFYDSSLISREVIRDDVKAFPIPATKMAEENGTPTLANMIIMGKVLKETDDFTEESVRAALTKVISAKRADMLDVNFGAIKLGYDF
ncbi:MAG: 2-oxoacid:acceptor oxidoreductase family protein [Clostridia bacterium]|nr:2-oxoacid:acceptor oxidoreductase family protein [Clostridia bacterium]MBQ7897808.1 2-oxoacid:acceptor oxidoreductase family protein [Clostridia bacterium]